MAKNITSNGKAGNAVVEKKPRLDTIAFAEHATEGTRQFTKFLGCIMRDVVSGELNSPAANAVCNAAGKILKLAEMQHRYGARKSAFDALRME